MTMGCGELTAETPYIWRTRRPGSTRRLICFPHAGAGATTYAEWGSLLPPEIELVAVQLPGRQNRIAEEPFTEVAPLVNVLVQALRPVLDRPFAFYGHSCGAALAYEMAQALQARGRSVPERLFLSAQPAPDVTVQQLHGLPDDEFRAELVRLGGLEEEVATDESLMASLLPTLRADFRLWERHRPAPGSSVHCPITALAGESDLRAPMEDMERWRSFTTAEFDLQRYPGGHFYHLDRTAEVVAFIGGRMLTGVMSGSLR